MSTANNNVSPLDNYNILSTIGKGGFGEVKMAKDKRNNNIVAIKIGSKNKSAYYQNEINILKALSATGCSKHILCLIESFIIDDFYYIVTEYVHGVTLRVFIRKYAPTFKEEINIMAQLAEAVMYLHSEEIAHRDLKPANIMIIPEGKKYKVKIIDFGLACSVQNRWNAPCPGITAGTPKFLAPEVLKGTVKDARTADVFALGCIFYFITTETDLFTADTKQLLYKAILENKHNSFDIVDDRLAYLIDLMISPVNRRIEIRDVTIYLWDMEDRLNMAPKIKTF